VSVSVVVESPWVTTKPNTWTPKLSHEFQERRVFELKRSNDTQEGIDWAFIQRAEGRGERFQGESFEQRREGER